MIVDLWDLTPAEEAALDRAYWDAPEFDDDDTEPDADPDD